LPPTPIAFKGNNTMLDFGKALVEKQPAFVFPFADNLRQSLADMETKAHQNKDTKQTLLAGGKN
jgi:hypothetical protein